MKNEDLDSEVEDTDHEDSDWNRRLLQVSFVGCMVFFFGAKIADKDLTDVLESVFSVNLVCRKN